MHAAGMQINKCFLYMCVYMYVYIYTYRYMWQGSVNTRKARRCIHVYNCVGTNKQLSIHPSIHMGDVPLTVSEAPINHFIIHVPPYGEHSLPPYHHSTIHFLHMVGSGHFPIPFPAHGQAPQFHRAKPLGDLVKCFAGCGMGPKKIGEMVYGVWVET